MRLCTSTHTLLSFACDTHSPLVWLTASAVGYCNCWNVRTRMLIQSRVDYPALNLTELDWIRRRPEFNLNESSFRCTEECVCDISQVRLVSGR